MTYAIEFRVVIWPKQSEVSAQGFAQLVSAAFPNCQIDWAAGDAITEQTIARLKGLGAPDEILFGERNLLGKRFTLTVQPIRNLALELHGVGAPVYRDLGDCLGFDLVPYEAQPLLKVARAFADPISFCSQLSYDESFEIRINMSPCTDPLHVAKKYVPVDPDEEQELKIDLLPVDEWRSTLCRGLLSWLEQSEHPKKLNDRTRAFDTLDHYAAAVANELEAVSPVKKAWIIEVSCYSHGNFMLLEQESCHAFVDLSGVPRPIFL